MIEISSELTQGNFEQYYFPATAIGFLDMLRYLLKHWNNENKKIEIKDDSGNLMTEDKAKDFIFEKFSIALMNKEIVN